MLENRILATEHMGRYTESVRAEDVNARMLKLESTVGMRGVLRGGETLWRTRGNC